MSTCCDLRWSEPRCFVAVYSDEKYQRNEEIISKEKYNVGER